MAKQEVRINLDIYLPLEQFGNEEEAMGYLIRMLDNDKHCDYQIYESETQ